MAKLTLSYFPIRARAEFMRLFLADAAVEFEDKRIPYDEEWKNNLKAQYPFVQLPVLDVQDEHGNNFRLPETNAILQYLEETYTVIPGYRELSPLERASIIAVRDASLAMLDTGGLWDFYWGENWTSDIEAMKKREASNHVWCQRVEAYLKTVNLKSLLSDPVEGEGTTLTTSAAVLFEVLEIIEGQFPGTLAKYETIAGIHAKILSRPRVAKYLKDGKRADKITLSNLETREKRVATTDAWKAANSA